MASSRRLLAPLVAGALVAGAVAHADAITDRVVYAIGLTAPTAWQAAPGVAYTAKLASGDPDLLRAALATTYQATREGALVRVRVPGYTPLPGAPGPGHRQPSFLVDYDEPVFTALRATVTARFGAHPTPEQLATFVDGYITTKNGARGDDLASVVATRKEGDCTEHAVLLAALVRMFGGTARLIGGIALVAIEHKPYAFGHAWIEVADGAGHWRPVDPTRPSERPDGRWLPLYVTADESIRYRAASMVELRLWPSHVTIE